MKKTSAPLATLCLLFIPSLLCPLSPARAEDGGPCITAEEDQRIKTAPPATAPAKPRPAQVAEAPAAKVAPPAAEPMAPAARPAPAPPRPPDVQADRIAVERIAPQQVEPVTEETKKEVTKLVADYFKAMENGDSTPEAKAKADKFVKEFGSEDWAVRENATKEIVKLGRAALGALREAAKSKDAEVATRAGEALKAVEADTAKPICNALRKYPQTVWVVVQGQIDSTRDEWTKARAAAAAAEKAGRKDEAEKLGADVKRLGGRISDLDRLYWIVQNYTRYDR